MVDNTPSDNLRCCTRIIELIAEIEVRLGEIKTIIQEPPGRSGPVPFLLPNELAEQVLIKTTPTELIVRPKAFLGRDTFKALSTIVKEYGGYYVSGGKDSHFVVPKPGVQR